MIDRRTFLRWLGMAPAIAAAPKMIGSPSHGSPKYKTLLSRNAGKTPECTGVFVPEGKYAYGRATEDFDIRSVVELDQGGTFVRSAIGVGGKPKDVFQSVVPEEVRVGSEQFNYLKYLNDKQGKQFRLGILVQKLNQGCYGWMKVKS
jgi:hypothetical protein